MIINPPIIKKIKEIINYNDKFCLFVHENPDVDALGSTCAFRDSLLKMGKDARIFAINSNICEKFKHLFNLPISDVDQDFLKESVAIILDTANKERILGFNDNQQFKKIIRIDHHPKVETIGDLDWNDDSASSTCEMVGWLIINTKLPIDENIINSLYAGMLTDTGKFMYNNVSKSTFDLLSYFCSFGFAKQKVQDYVFLNDFKNVKLDNIFRKKIKTTNDGVGYLILNKRICNKYKQYCLNDKVYLMAGIKEIKIWFFIYYNFDLNCWKGSIRSRDFVVNDIAKQFGGGGHKNASGFKLNNLNEYKKVIALAQKVIHENEAK